MRTLRTLLAAVLILLPATGCAGLRPAGKIAKKEAVFLDYTCQTQAGEIIFTTDPDIAQDRTLKKSRIFSYPNDYASGPVTAGLERAHQQAKGIPQLELELYYRLSQALVDLEKEEEHQITLESEVLEGLADGVRFQVRPRIVTASRFKTIPRYEYDRVHQNPPEIGMLLKNSNIEEVAGRVTAFDDKTVSYEITLPPGFRFDSSIGPATMEIKGDQVITVFNARVGTLVRWNRSIGKIVDVTDKAVTIDYGHPFAGEKLKCKVKAFSHNPYPEMENKMNSDD